MGLGAVDKSFATDRNGTPAVPDTAPLFSAVPAVPACFLILSIYMIALQWSGSSLNRDGDDLLKLHELRTFLATGNVFDRRLPGILQPEPYVSHWPWIIDLPYALVAWPLTPLLGSATALSVACFAVPLLLLAPMLYLYGRLISALGFATTVVPLFLAVTVAISSFFEFAPFRVDYHNLQILLFFTALMLVLSQHRLAAFACGLVVALAIAISFEFAVFHALVMAVFAFDFVFARDRGSARLRDFGIGMGLGGLLLFFAIVPPSAYGIGKCDTYSAPYALALVLAGAAFAALPSLAGRLGNPLARAALLAGLAVASLGLLLALFPQCAGGPYGEMSPHLRAVALGSFPQEQSFFRRPDFVLSNSFAAMILLFSGALAPLALWLGEKRHDRALIVVALASLLALVQTIAYFRYLRYLPFFSGIGLLFVLSAVLPATIRSASGLDPAAVSGKALRLVLPGVVLAGALALYHLTVRLPQTPTLAADFAGSCDLADAALPQGWPAGAIVLSPPAVGAYLLVQPSGPAVVAIPNHPAARGMDRSYRFFDKATADPRVALNESRATHVAICAWNGQPDPAIAAAYPFAAALMEGRPPEWLMECPGEAGSRLRIYSYRKAEGSQPGCPAVPAIAQARP